MFQDGSLCILKKLLVTKKDRHVAYCGSSFLKNNESCEN
jgi:hypothetical protein